MQKLDIAVAGAGPAGLASALYLLRLGHKVSIYERFETARPLGSGLILQPTGLAVLHDLGLFEGASALGQRLERLRGTDAKSGRIVLDVRYDALRGSGNGLGIHRAALFGLLHEAVVEAGILIRTGVTITGVDHKGGKRVLFAGSKALGAFDLVIDCLGAGSPLLHLARSGGRVRQLSYGALWATVPWVEEGFDSSALLQRYQRASVMIGVLPVGRQVAEGPELAAFFWSLKTADHAALVAAGLEAWKDRVWGLWPEAMPHLNAIGSFDDLTLARYSHHTLSVAAGQGIVFVGDSAHSTSPQLGQGANMALLDARALYLSLRDAESVNDVQERYCGLRHRHVRIYQVLSLALTPFYQSDSRVLPLIRDLLVSNLAHIPPGPQFLAAMVAGLILNPVLGLGLEPAPSH